ADFADVIVCATRELGRQRMRTEKRGAECDLAQASQLARCAQLLAFVIQREAIAGFDLDAREAFGNQGVEARQGRANEIGCAGRAAVATDGRDGGSHHVYTYPTTGGPVQCRTETSPSRARQVCIFSPHYCRRAGGRMCTSGLREGRLPQLSLMSSHEREMSE